MKKKTKTNKELFNEYLLEKTPYFINKLNLNHWGIKIGEADKDKVPKDVCMIVTFAGEGYLKAKLSWSDDALSFFKDKDFITLERCIIHELIHVMLYSYAESAINRFITSDELQKQEELVCDHLAIALQDVFNNK